jgi:cytidine deaminase
MSNSKLAPELQLRLIDAAQAAYSNSYSPYSGLRVGAAVLTSSGQLITGTNVENASFSLTVCAERAALITAVGQGHRNFTAIAIVAQGKRLAANQLLSPCGACRQVLAEFAHLSGNDIEVIMSTSDRSNINVMTISELLPAAMTADEV